MNAILTHDFVLPSDVILVEAQNLSASVRSAVTFDEGDYAITRPHTRTPSQIISAPVATLLQEFISPKSVVEAVLSYSLSTCSDPETTLDEAFPLLQGFIMRGILVVADSEAAEAIIPSLEVGTELNGFKVTRTIRIVADSEIYQVQDEVGTLAALKILRPLAPSVMQTWLAKESKLLTQLDGKINPRLLATGVYQNCPYLIMSWIEGTDPLVVAQQLRHPTLNRPALLELALAIVDAYAHLHAQGILHGDIHPQNLVVDETFQVTILDYGLAQGWQAEPNGVSAPRGGVGFYLEPELAKAQLEQGTPPPSTVAGEQYSLATLLYSLFSGAHYLSFSLEREEMLRQIVEETPLSFAQQGVHTWREVEEILQRALSKAPAQRFGSMAEFAQELRNITLPETLLSLTDSPLILHKESELLLDTVLKQLHPDAPLFTNGLPSAPTISFNYGVTGIAYALYRMAVVLEEPKRLAEAELWLAQAYRNMTRSDAFSNATFQITETTVGAISPFHTPSGVYAVQALLSHVRGDFVTQQRAIEMYVVHASGDCEHLDATLGYTSVLLVSAILMDTLKNHPHLHTTSLRTLGDITLARIWQTIDDYQSIATGQSLPYLGAAHGWAGLLYATLCWCYASGTPFPATLERRLQELADCAIPAGSGVRWQWLVTPQGSSRHGNYMSGWCNGSAGYIPLWTEAYRLLDNPLYLTLAERAAWDTYNGKGASANLCCGLAGQAYGLLNLYRTTQERIWLERAYTLANLAARRIPITAPFDVTGEDTLPAHSLYKGQVGVALLIAELTQPQMAIMPLFEREGW